MQILYTLTEEEYNELLEVKQQPDILLKETNSQLKSKLDACEAKLQQGAFDNSRVDTPFIVTNNKLHFRSPTDFIIMYNSLAQANFKLSDTAVFKYMKQLSELFNYDLHFESESAVKAYRVSLQKKSIITKKIIINGKLKLLTKD